MAVRTSKPVNLYQLGQEIGGSSSLRATGRLDGDGDKTVESSIGDTALSAALDAHTADPSLVAPTPPPTAEEANSSTIRQQAANALDMNRTYVGTASPTAAQTVAQVKALSRQLNGLIRLALGQLDNTD